MTQQALLIVAHGSRRQASNQEVAALVDFIAQIVPLEVRVEHAFLELANPKFSDALQQLLSDGVNQIDVFPYFLAAGTHVVDDLPAIIAQHKAQFPDAQINLIQHLGKMPGLAELIAQQINLI
ncbi:cobalamin biosynthesis protein CbiX [Alginatibacterium sediminis]|uniref:Cobalamin biosynthesis protein CbiX n=1 Tax=Alginatibacterium sediminis TaxID=2164068 RepID=A0A420E7E8_9ALTE|nr:CbiX/SirB N-terminal domain-containing protein [Alginatibacterium sediminis]RKF14446.1 cobalamin biosynthesis protein CbiX [Alginatibacterium sediminis]